MDMDKKSVKYFCVFLIFSSPELKAQKVSLSLELAFVSLSVSAFTLSNDRQADGNQILYEASLGLGKGCIRFW